MKILLGLILAIAELLFFWGAGIWIGLWWWPAVAHNNIHSSFVTATFSLFIGGVYLWRNVFGKASKFKQYAYVVLGGGGLVGYLYGIILIYFKT